MIIKIVVSQAGAIVSTDIKITITATTIDIKKKGVKINIDVVCQ
jgi:hypothetical protein